jgi:hypothetical protein
MVYNDGEAVPHLMMGWELPLIHHQPVLNLRLTFSIRKSTDAHHDVACNLIKSSDVS